MFNTGCGNDIFPILILLCCSGGKTGDCGCGCYEKRGGCDCCDLVMMYLLLSCCCGGGKDGCGK